jgi:hypothetical protein
VPKVCSEVLNPLCATRVTAFFFALLNAAKSLARDATSLAGAPALRNFVSDPLFEVEVQLLIEFLLHLVSVQQRSQLQGHGIKHTPESQH